MCEVRKVNEINPIIRADFPAPDVIRVDDCYYMLCATFHFVPGGVLLRSYDLVHWEIAGHVFARLEGTPSHRLEGEMTSYSKGMWPGCIRHHDGKYIVVFSMNAVNRLYFYTSEAITGPWEGHSIEGYYHEPSLLFDDDGRVYAAYGHGEIFIRELNPDLSGWKSDGLFRCVLRESGDMWLPYEGCHFQKINGRYYLSVAHWPKEEPARRTHLCFRADTVDGEFAAQPLHSAALSDDRGYHNLGVAQGSLVDTPEGDWYALLYQDHGAVGRLPVLVPVSWEEGWPVFGRDGKVPELFDVPESRPGYTYQALYTSDRFLPARVQTGVASQAADDVQSEPVITYRLKEQWEWNHEPDDSLWSLLPDGGLCLQTGKISINLIHARNTLTQRMMWPSCAASVSLDASEIKEGDFAGICVLQGCYGMIGVTRERNQYYLTLVVRLLKDNRPEELSADYLPGTVLEKRLLGGPRVKLKIAVDFTDLSDTAEFFYQEENGKRWIRLDYKHNIYFKLDHFVGGRFGLYMYATKKIGGTAVFRDFKYLV